MSGVYFDVIVIGGGTAGLVTASGCARLGRRVALIDKASLGGDCLWTGCVPTKSLVASARLAHQMRHARDWGLEPVEPRIWPRAVMESMRQTRRTISKHDDPQKFRDLGIDVIEGEARFVSRTEVEVSGRVLSAKDIVIATGSRTAVPPIEGLAETGFLDHTTFLEGNELPQSVLIIGGGAIGVEFAQIFRRLGCAVTIVEPLDTILAKEDPDAIGCIREVLSGEGVEIRTHHSVQSVRREGTRIVARIESRIGQVTELAIDAIFIAAGRRGNIERLGLEDIGVATEQSYVKVDRFLQTSVPRIWACGDVHGGPQFTHVAAYEAVKLVRNMLFPGRSAVDYANIPWAIYTDPEVAHLGESHGPRVYRVDMNDVDRAVIDRTSGGFVKLVCDRQGRILGAHIVAANASTLIAPIALARKKGMRIGELAQLVTPYPSLADAIQRAAAQHYQELSGSWIGAVGRRIAAWAQ